MKTTLSKFMLALFAILFVLTGAAANLMAHDGQWDTRHHYYRDNYGYWDDHDRYHHYIIYHEHHGYWDDRGGFRVFINVE